MADCRVLLVDNDEQTVTLLQNMLEDEFELVVIPDRLLGMALFGEFKPDALLFNPARLEAPASVISDQVRRENPGCHLICLADQEDLAEAISFFEAGIDDYLVKPLNPVAIRHKIRTAREAWLARTNLDGQAMHARSMAFSMMEANSELGTLLRCIEATMAAKSFGALSQAIVALADEFAVKIAFQLRTDRSVFNVGCDADSIEARVLAAGRTRSKIVENRGRLIINQDRISLLVTDLDTLETTRYGRLKDNLAILLSTAESRILSLERELMAESRRSEIISGVTDHVRVSMENIRRQFTAYEHGVWQNVLEFKDHMADIMMKMAIDDDHEVILMHSIDGFLHKLTETQQTKAMIDSSFETLLNELDKL